MSQLKSKKQLAFYNKLKSIFICKCCGGNTPCELYYCDRDNAYYTDCCGYVCDCKKTELALLPRNQVLRNSLVSALKDPKNYLQKLIEELECPVCYEQLKNTSWMCLNGHAMCNQCRFQLDSCPVCRQPELHELFNISSHVYDVLKMLEKPITCRYSDNGCSHEGSYLELDRHEREVCNYRPNMCEIPGCCWKGDSSYLITHIRKFHEGVALNCSFNSPIRLVSAGLYMLEVKLGSTIYNYWTLVRRDPVVSIAIQHIHSTTVSPSSVLITPSDTKLPISVPVYSLSDGDIHSCSPYLLPTQHFVLSIPSPLVSTMPEWLSKTLLFSALVANTMYGIVSLTKK